MTGAENPSTVTPPPPSLSCLAVDERNIAALAALAGDSKSSVDVLSNGLHRYLSRLLVEDGATDVSTEYAHTTNAYSRDYVELAAMGDSVWDAVGRRLTDWRKSLKVGDAVDASDAVTFEKEDGMTHHYQW